MLRRIQTTCDAVAGWAYYPGICVILALATQFTRWYGRKLSLDWEQWMVAEWLISYAPGFVRRGLSGTLLLAVSRMSGVPANLVVWWTIVAVFGVFCASVAVLLWGRRLTFWYVALCVSPAFVLFSFYNPSTVGRKEGLVLAALGLWMLVVSRRSVTVPVALAFASLSAVLTLVHELFFFYSGYFVLAACVSPHGRARGLRTAAWLVPAASLAALLLIIPFSASLNDPAICQRLLALGAPPRVCEGVLEYHHIPTGEAFQALLTSAGAATIRGFLLVFPVVLVPVWLFASATIERARARYGLLLMLAALIGASFPLFALAVDWGRWVAIHAAASTLVCALFLPPRNQPRPRVIWSVGTVLSLGTGVVILLSSLTWSLKYCCGTDFLSAWTPVTVIENTWADLDL